MGIRCYLFGHYGDFHDGPCHVCERCNLHSYHHEDEYYKAWGGLWWILELPSWARSVAWFCWGHILLKTGCGTEQLENDLIYEWRVVFPAWQLRVFGISKPFLDSFNCKWCGNRAYNYHQLSTGFCSQKCEDEDDGIPF